MSFWVFVTGMKNPSKFLLLLVYKQLFSKTLFSLFLWGVCEGSLQKHLPCWRRRRPQLIPGQLWESPPDRSGFCWPEQRPGPGRRRQECRSAPPAFVSVLPLASLRGNIPLVGCRAGGGGGVRAETGGGVAWFCTAAGARLAELRLGLGPIKAAILRALFAEHQLPIWSYTQD